MEHNDRSNTTGASPSSKIMRSLSGKRIINNKEIDKDLWACRTVRLPGNDFETDIWGEAGVPIAAPKATTITTTTPLPTSRTGPPPPSAFSALHNNKVSFDTKEESADVPEIRLTNFCWKRRSGMGKFSVIHPWEKRRLVLVGTKVLYFSLLPQEEEEFNNDTTSSQNDTDATSTKTTTRPPWLEQAVANLEKETNNGSTAGAASPRGVIDLTHEGAHVEASEGNFNSPAPYEIDLRIRGDISWKLCFESQPVQIEWLAALADVIQSNAPEKEHKFEAGDHVIRWEMLPIVYPIQIHGIVLEAGRNCVIIADFGLTSYGKASSPKGEEEDVPKEESHDFVMAAWKKIRPPKESRQRLNVIALTDPKEIRQWSKINYGRNVFASAKSGKFKAWFQNKGVSNVSEGALAFNEENAAKELEEAIQYIADMEQGDNDVTDDKQDNNEMEESEQDVENHALLDPEWFIQNDEPSEGASSQELLRRPPVFTLTNNDDDSSEQKQKLPKSDPKKIVLARTNFLLEYGEEVLPPYHVFHSNSECIAVWCKTGRWSTLQTAVFLHSTAIGNAKSATAITLGVAAAHVVLVPALAVGGLAMVTAPWLILKKSKAKWDEATMRLTGLFWDWAEPEVFVEAIENWSGLCPTPEE